MYGENGLDFVGTDFRTAFRARAGVANLLRQGKLDQLETAMQSGGATGMQTMDSALMELVESGVISTQEAYQQANNKAKFKSVRDNPDDPLDEFVDPL